MKTRVFFIILALCVIVMPLKAEVKLLDLANASFARGNFQASLGLFKRIAADLSSTPEVKSAAYEKIGFIFSRFYQNNDSAIFYASKNLHNAHQYCLASGYSILQGDFPKAITFCQEALQISANYRDSMESSEAYSDAVLKFAGYKLQNHESIDFEMLKDTWVKLAYCHHNEPESPTVNEKRVETAFMLKHGNDVLQCWKDYFLIQKDDFPAENLEEAFAGLNSVLRDWNGEVLNKESYAKIIRALSLSRFYPLIENLQTIFPTDKSHETDCIMAFCKYRHDMEDHIYSFYRNLALHKENKREFSDGIRVLNLQLWNTLYPGNSRKYSEVDFRKALLDQFGTLLYFHSKGRIQVYFGGSAVVRESRPFEQYGHNADFNFSQVDFIFGNAYDFWYTGQGLRIGGWDEDDENSHFRRNVLNGPTWVWNERAKSQDLLNRWKTEIDRESMRDDSLSRIHTLADLPGVRDRIEYRFIIKTLDSLKALNLSGEMLRASFIRTLMDYDNSHNYWHEGRHNLDARKRFAILHSHNSFEYRAKLSQISFASMPSFELERAFYYNPKMKSRDGHSVADAKIVTSYYNWMNAHREEIQGLDHNRPIICQVDLLSEDQIRNIARSLDPLYRKWMSQQKR